VNGELQNVKSETIDVKLFTSHVCLFTFDVTIHDCPLPIHPLCSRANAYMIVNTLSFKEATVSPG
jgi:hypothetical protein